jgi:molybdate transport system substrate-binding protein
VRVDALEETAEVSSAIIRVPCTFGLRQVVDVLAPAFERQHRCTIERVYESSVAHMRRFSDGETADAALLTAAGIDQLIAMGRIERRIDLAHSGIGVAVKAGAPHPDISTPEAFKAALLAAKSICHSQTGASGIYFMQLIKRLGIANEISAKAVIDDGLAGVVVARGDAELAVQQTSELMQASGIDIVGPLPGELQNVTIFSGGVFKGAPPLAKAFIASLSTTEASAVIQSNGMDAA